MKRYVPFVIILFVLIVALGAGWYLTRKPASSSGVSAAASPAALPAKSSSSPTVNLAAQNEPGAMPPHAIGPAEAPVTLEEFGDFDVLPAECFIPF